MPCNCDAPDPSREENLRHYLKCILYCLDYDIDRKAIDEIKEKIKNLNEESTRENLIECVCFGCRFLTQKQMKKIEGFYGVGPGFEIYLFDWYRSHLRKDYEKADLNDQKEEIDFYQKEANRIGQKIIKKLDDKNNEYYICTDLEYKED